MSSIKSQVETYGNWEIVKEKTPRKKTRYFMNDIHPGKRTYGFDRTGKRVALWFLTESPYNLSLLCGFFPPKDIFDKWIEHMHWD